MNVKTIITHDNCADGIASALILKLAWPDAEVFHATYGKPLPSPSDGMVFVDFSPPPDAAQGYVDAGAWCLDHHVGAKDVVALFSERGRYASTPGVSGAYLAAVFVWGRELSMTVAELETFAKLIGIRDTWQKDNPDWEWACEVSAGLHFVGFDAAINMARHRTGSFIGRVAELGAFVRSDRTRLVDKAAANAHLVVLASGTKLAVFDGYTLSSDAAEHPKLRDCDLVAGHVSAGLPDGRISMRFSCRSRRGYDVLALAKRNGGGGHHAAAGFEVSGRMPIHPFEVFVRVVESHEELLFEEVAS